MPKQLFEIKDFLMTARTKAAKQVIIKRNLKGENKLTKFKLRTQKGLYTLVIRNKDKAVKIEQSLPVELAKVHIPKLSEEEKKTRGIKKGKSKKTKTTA